MADNGQPIVVAEPEQVEERRKAKVTRAKKAKKKAANPKRAAAGAKGAKARVWPESAGKFIADLIPTRRPRYQ
jgi:transposase